MIFNEAKRDIFRAKISIQNIPRELDFGRPEKKTPP